MNPSRAYQRRGLSGLKILGIIFLVLILACGGFIAFVAASWRGWVAEGIRGPLVKEVQNSSLPDDQKESIVANLNRFADKFEAKEITKDQLVAMGERLKNEHFFDLIAMEGIRAKHLDQLQLSDEQRQQANITFDRFARGIVEEKIPESEFSPVLDKVAPKNSSGAREIPETLDNAKLTDFIAEMKAKADAAGIPEEPYQVDYAGLVNSAVETVLGPQEGAQPETEPAEGAATQPTA
jgi:hypothetical protein